MTYYPSTDEDRKEMFDSIGVRSFEELIANVPAEIRFKEKLNIPARLSEFEVLNELQRLADTNTKTNIPNFMGAGSYDHYVPSAIQAITSRSEYYTAYTPYQAEVSQGTLQAIYEFQTMICQLTGMDLANASMYDGGSALAEAIILSAAHTRRSEILIAGKLHPDYRRIVDTYCKNQDVVIRQIPVNDGVADIDAIRKAVSENTAAVVVQQPNFYGCLEDVFTIGEIAREKKSIYIAVVNPISLGVLSPPGEYGADITVGEGQPFGIGLNFGGPYLGIFAVKEFLMRKIPGRLAGITVDTERERGFVLTLQTREQQIRREKATSNICTNQGLMMLAATVYLALMGKQGLQEVANLCLQKSHYLAEKIEAIGGVSVKYQKPFFNEFVVHLPKPASQVLKILAAKGILGGLPLERWNEDTHDLMIAVTEKRSKQDLDSLVQELQAAVQ
jgi:glycine dehydrogenase subunit 1